MCLPKGSLSDHRYRIKVEQSVTQPPPHRSRRAVLPHRAVKHFLQKRPPIWKKGLRPILCFIEETREYLIGKLRKGTTVSGKETAAFIASIKEHLPGCVREVLLRADSEFLSWESIEAAMKAGF